MRNRARRKRKRSRNRRFCSFVIPSAVEESQNVSDVLWNFASRDVSTSLDMTVLALETSCDETGVAILCGRDDHSAPELLASEVASQIAAHQKYGGIVPEIASRNHLVHAPRLPDPPLTPAPPAFSHL